MHEIGIAIVDDDPTFLEAAAALIGVAADMWVVGTADGGDLTDQLLLLESVDIALVDICMPRSGIDVVRAALRCRPDLCIVLVSAVDPPALPQDLCDAGVAFMPKERLDADVLRRLWCGHC